VHVRLQRLNSSPLFKALCRVLLTTVNTYLSDTTDFRSPQAVQCWLPIKHRVQSMQVHVQGKALDIASVFYALALLHLPKLSMAQNFVHAVEAGSELQVSMKRINDFLSLPEPPAPAHHLQGPAAATAKVCTLLSSVWRCHQALARAAVCGLECVSQSCYSCLFRPFCFQQLGMCRCKSC